MIPGVTPLGVVPMAVIWAAPDIAGTVEVPAIEAQVPGPQVWLVDIGTLPPAAVAVVPPYGWGIGGHGPMAAPEIYAPVAAQVPVIRLSDRGWIGEPTDAIAPNVEYPPRLAAPVAIERTLPIYPDQGARLTATAGEIAVMNGDQRMDAIAGDWAVGGRRVIIRHGPHQRPRHAAFSNMRVIADLRAAGTPSGTSRLALALRGTPSEVDVSACEVFGGGGGLDGDPGLAGQFKPRLLGEKRSVEPVLIDQANLISMVHSGSIGGITAAYDRGVPLSSTTNVADYAALIAAGLSSGQYATCNALGLTRTAVRPSVLTVDVLGDNAAGTGGYSSATPTSFARKMLEGVAGVAFDAANFDWPVGASGLSIRSGSVADAMNQIAAGVFGWWGADAEGAYHGGMLLAPEALTATLTIDQPMMAAPPEEIAPTRAPWWRIRFGYDLLGRTLTDEQVAGAVAADDAAYWRQAARIATAYDTDIQGLYAEAQDAPLVNSIFASETDAQSRVDQMLAIFGVPRRMWVVRIRPGAGGYAWSTLRLGACVLLTWSRHRALAAGRKLIVIGVSIQGERTSVTLWG